MLMRLKHDLTMAEAARGPSGSRVDLLVVADMVEHGARVLDEALDAQLVMAAAVTARGADVECRLRWRGRPGAKLRERRAMGRRIAERRIEHAGGLVAQAAGVAGGESQRFVQEMDIPCKWWTLFRSRGLNTLIDRSLKANPTLDAVMAALRQASENVHAQEGKFFPLVQANYTPMREQIAQSVVGNEPIPGVSTFNLHTAQGLISYTLDVWGLNRRTVESLQAQAESQRFLVEAAYLTLISNVVAAAVQEASLRDQIAATHKLIDLNTEMLGILQKQLATGYENRIDVAIQEAQLAQMRATLPPLEKALAQQRDLLTALMGRFPSEEPREKFELATLHLPRDLPVSLPSKLIEQRPDVRSAEELLHSASAQIGVAVANMLPNISLSANGGYTALDLASLFSPANKFWALTGNATQTVFDGFSLLHQERAAEATFQ